MYETPAMLLSLAAFIFCQWYFSSTYDTEDLDLYAYYDTFYEVAYNPATWFLILLVTITIFISLTSWRLCASHAAPLLRLLTHLERSIRVMLSPPDYQILNEIDYVEEKAVSPVRPNVSLSPCLLTRGLSAPFSSLSARFSRGSARSSSRARTGRPRRPPTRP